MSSIITYIAGAKKFFIAPESEHRKSGYAERKRRLYQSNVVTGASMRRTLKICRSVWTRFGNCPDSLLPSLPPSLCNLITEDHWYW